MDETLMSGGVQAPQSMPGMYGSTGLTPEQMQDDLDGLMDVVKDKYAIFEGKLSSSNSQIAQAQQEAIAMLFEILQNNGIDPSDQEQVAQFLQELKDENPEGYAIFEQAINSLLNQQSVSGEMVPPIGMTGPETESGAMTELPPPVPGPEIPPPPQIQ